MEFVRAWHQGARWARDAVAIASTDHRRALQASVEVVSLATRYSFTAALPTCIPAM